MRILKGLATLCIPALVGLNIHAEELQTCHWRSVPIPEAKIEIHSKSIIGIMSGDLIYKGKRVRQLLFGQPNGYGSRWWAFEGKDGKHIGGGRLLPFRGVQPIRGIRTEIFDQSTPRRALLVGLGSSLHYSDLRGEWDLNIAGEGFWQLDKGCYFPGRDSLN